MDIPTNKIKALQELAARGSTQGERDNAAQKLDALCLKYNLKLEDLKIEGKDWVAFRVEGHIEFHIVHSAVLHCLDHEPEFLTDGHNFRAAYKLTQEEARIVTDCVVYYLGLWRKDTFTVLQAFVMKNQLYPGFKAQPVEGTPKQEINRDLFRNAMIIMDGLTKGAWTNPGRNLKKLS